VTFFRRVTDHTRERGGKGSEPSDEPRYLFVARFSAADAMLLRELVSQVAQLIAGPAAGRGPAPGQGTPGAAGDLGDDLAGGPGGDPGGDPGHGPGGDPAGDLRGLAEALGLTEDASLPDDPALARLLPDAYPDDPDASREFRRYTEKDLRADKVAAARTVLATLPERGGRIRLSQPEAQMWLRALNDIRLALGVRLGVTEDAAEEMGRLRPDDPRYGVLAVYDWLSGTQESLVRALW
jgi:uncharacterized protein DUF2017